MAYSLSGERPLVAAWPSTILSSLLRRLAQLAKARRQRIAIASLLDMDDYRLWDLGISRADLTRALRADNFDVDAIRVHQRGVDIWPPR